MTFFPGRFLRLFKRNSYRPLSGDGQVDAVSTPQKTARAYTTNLSPFQLWLNRLISQIVHGTFDDEYLPYFSKSTAYLQDRFRPLSEGKKWEFFWQWDVAGLLLLGGFLEVGNYLTITPFSHLFYTCLNNPHRTRLVPSARRSRHRWRSICSCKTSIMKITLSFW